MILILAFVVLLLLVFCLRAQGKGISLAIRDAFVIWACLVVYMTELLNLLGAVNAVGVTVAWGLTLVLIAAAYVRASRLELASSLPKFADATWLVSAILLALGGLTLASALLSPPNGWDVLAYHLPRVVHWASQGSVSHFAASYLPELGYGPFAGYLQLHLLLSGTDRWTHVISWLCYVGCVPVAELVAKQLGAERRTRLLACVWVATMPEAILQASGAYVDLVSAFWLLVFVSLVLEVNNGASHASTWGKLGAVAGLLFLTKATVFLLAVPLGVWLGCLVIGHFDGRAIRNVVLAGVIALTLIAGHATRNIKLFGSMLGKESDGDTCLVTNPSVKYALSNVVREFASEFATPSHRLNVYMERAVRLAHRALRVDPDDPNTTHLAPAYKFGISSATNQEDSSSHPLHWGIGVVALVLALRHYRALLPSQKKALLLLSVLTSSALLFAYEVRWNTTGTRYFLPLTVSAGPAWAVLVSVRRRRTLTLIVATLGLAALPFALVNRTRPILSLPVGPGTTVWPLEALRGVFSRSEDRISVLQGTREDLLFILRPDLREPYTDLARQVAKYQPQDAAFVLSPGIWEYALQQCLAKEIPSLRVRHIMPNNVSQRLQSGTQVPEVVIWVVDDAPDSLQHGAAMPEKLDVAQRSFQRVWSAQAAMQRFAVFVRNSALAEPSSISTRL